MLKNESRSKYFLGTLMLVLLTLIGIAYAGTTGKLTGKVTDADTGEPVIGANILIDGTYMGAAADVKGEYVINNIPPGEYTVSISAVGYQKTIVEKVLIKIDLTTNINVKLRPAVINLEEEVVITADRPLVQKDLTSTNAIVTASDIAMMPVEDVGQIINLQAGVQRGANGGFHFRGGRSNEVAFLVDGISVSDVHNNGIGVEVENSNIRQMEIISGTFNAEYGQAMSGVVNIVTQDGSSKFEGSVNAYLGSYFTTHTDIFRNLDKFDVVPTRNVQFNLSGPIFMRNLTFFTTARYYENDGYLYGRRVYNTYDENPFMPTGDGQYVLMNPDRKYSFNGKLTYSIASFKVSYSLFWDDNYNRYYDHGYSWTPDGTTNHYRTNYIHGLQLSHYPSSTTYQTLKFSYNDHRYKGYLYEDPWDIRYVDPTQGTAQSSYTFRSGGNHGGRYKRNTETMIAQWALTSQLTKEHKIGIGLEGRQHRLFNHYLDLVSLSDEEWLPGYPDLGTVTEKGRNQMYEKKPYELSAYIQDKMEYDIMIINAGVRVDYFDPNATLPVDLKNVTKNPDFPGNNEFKKASAKFQVSPRLGASFPITDQGIIRFSYGHFFQLPDFEHLYSNSDFIISHGQSLSSITGNPDLKTQKTVMYEIGLQQVLYTNLVLNFSVYYRDIRNLLGMEIINTYEGFKYARFINRDYGNVRGFIATLDKRFANFFGAKIDYTYQIAEGNASDPYAVYNNNQTNPPIEETKRVVPLNWDQRHTFNLSLNFGNPGDWNLGFIIQYGSGWPYTEDIKVSQGVRFENGGVKPSTMNVDLRAEKIFRLAGVNLMAFAIVYNVLDIKNEYGVYSTTGRATVDLNTKDAGDIYGLNTIEEYIKNPGMYSTPREIRLGIGFGI
jgi:outer membrane receptor protein involved in Fe transport